MSRKTIMAVIWIALMVWGVGTLRANNIRVGNVASWRHEPDKQELYVVFDLRWDNSWRNEVNWDAAWVFVKFRAPGSNQWEHAYLSTDSADHHGRERVIEPAPDGMGVFIYADGEHAGTVNYVNTRLLWQYGTNGYAFAHGDVVELSVHAIEMVYVPEGAFYVGSGGEETGSFTDGAWTGGATIPLAITSEDALPIETSEGALWGTDPLDSRNGIGGPGELPAKYPKGYAAFYCMKYDITQGQYAEFLNLLTEDQQSARFPDQYGEDRHTIRLDGDVYVADRPDRACNYLAWGHGMPYAAWAGLRPMTELEFEKACRGPEYPVPNENPWGTATIMSSPLDLSGAEDGTETVITSAADGGFHAVGATVTSGDGGAGPVRVGIFATNGATRVTAGASYWGIMELSGNVRKRIVSVAEATSRNFEGSHGAGTLDLPGDWPSWMGSRGGAAAAAPVSRRQYASDDRQWDNDGFRAVRRAPSGVGE